VVQKEILDAYILDFTKHAPKDGVMKIMAIWDSVPSQLAKENENFHWVLYRASLRNFTLDGYEGFFEEAFVWKWQESKSQDNEFLRRHCQDLHAYCQSYLGPTCNYHSIRELIDLFKEQDGLLSSVEEGMTEDPILSDYSGFRSSFRVRVAA
jgi:hypothetical protein